MQASEAPGSSANSLALVIGSEVLTLKRVLDFCRNNRDRLSLKGVIGTTDDPELDRIVRSMIAADGNGISYMKEVCDPKQLKSVSGYRDNFSHRLAEAVTRIGPTVTGFANMMYVVTEKFTGVHGDNAVNMHPSKLPSWRGGHPEFKAFKACDLQNIGWTMHTLNAVRQMGEKGRTVDLDNGTVLAHQQVPSVEPYDTQMAARLKKLYDSYQEERIRLAVMMASSLHAAAVFALFSSTPPERMKVVKDEEAFAAEGTERRNFFHSGSFQELLRQDYDGWLKSRKKSSEQCPFENWIRDEYPGYHRALFLDLNSGRFETAERILGISSIAVPQEIDLHAVTNYKFCIRVRNKEEGDEAFAGIRDFAMGGGSQLYDAKIDLWDPQQGNFFAQVTTSRNLAAFLGTFCSWLEVKTLPVRVGAEKAILPAHVEEYRRIVNQDPDIPIDGAPS